MKYPNQMNIISNIASHPKGQINIFIKEISRNIQRYHVCLTKDKSIVLVYPLGTNGVSLLILGRIH